MKILKMPYCEIEDYGNTYKDEIENKKINPKSMRGP
jgi:hypothetical protein